MPQPPQGPRDTLFQQNIRPEDFEFNDRVVEVFDDMLDRSVPSYKEVIVSISRLLDLFLCPGDTVYDLGCATGSTLLGLSRLLPDKGLQYIGLDNSPPMLEKARLKVELFSKQEMITFQQKDITSTDHTGVGAYILNYTLQFIRPLRREEFIQNLFAGLRPGGVLIISEKILFPDHGLNRKYIDIYHQFKKSRGYSELEIAKKREALENVLIPFSMEENLSLLTRAGFVTVAPFFQWFNFASFIAVKSA